MDFKKFSEMILIEQTLFALPFAYLGLLFAGGGSIPLEAQRLGLEAHASDLNPVAVMINKALIEIPPRFANKPAVNPRDRKGTGGAATWKGAAGLAADVRYYGEWMRDRAWERIGHLYPPYVIRHCEERPPRHCEERSDEAPPRVLAVAISSSRPEEIASQARDDTLWENL